MDAELLELQRQFEFAQQAKSSVRLSDRNVVELVQKLQHLQIIDFDLLHTVSGKEYITPEQLRQEIVVEIKKLGRVSVIDLADITGVDLYHVEKQAQHVVSNDTTLMLINGEIISNFYWDTVAEEINDHLQECSQIALAEIAAQYQVGSELLVTVLEPRLGNLVKGRLEGGQLYTPAYVTRVSAMVRGAARGITVPVNLSALWSSLQLLLQEMDGASGIAVEGSFFQSLFNGLMKEGEILGSLRAGVHWTPTVFATAQKDSVDAFFSQNSFISYETLHKLGIPQDIQFLQARYPEGIPLVTLFVHPSMIDILDAAVEDAIERGSWIDTLSVLPAAFASQDAFKILSLCPSIQVALKSNGALILGDSYVFSNGFIKNLFDSLEKESQTSSLSGVSTTLAPKSLDTSTDSVAESNETGTEIFNNKHTSETGSKKKRGKSTGSAKTGAAESSSDNQEPLPNKSKRNQKKGKAMAVQLEDSKSIAKKNVDKMHDDSLNIFPEMWLIQSISKLVPDLEEQGINDQEIILTSLAHYLRPMLLHSWKERRKAMFTDNSQRMKHLLDNLQRKLDESSLNMQLYEKALDLFEDDPSTSVLLHRHLLRSTATPMVDTLLRSLDMHNKLKNGIEVEELQNSELVSFSAAERLALAKSLHGHLSVKAVALVEALEGKRVETFLTSLRAMAEESGISLKKLDKKLERTLLHSYRKELLSQVSAETDPIALLPKVVSLLYMQVHSRALQAPGRAISVAVSRLKALIYDKFPKLVPKDMKLKTTLVPADKYPVCRRPRDDLKSDLDKLKAEDIKNCDICSGHDGLPEHGLPQHGPLFQKHCEGLILARVIEKARKTLEGSLEGDYLSKFNDINLVDELKMKYLGMDDTSDWGLLEALSTKDAVAVYTEPRTSDILNLSSRIWSGIDVSDVEPDVEKKVVTDVEPEVEMKGMVETKDATGGGDADLEKVVTDVEKKVVTDVELKWR